jgi:hypothetical protein
MCGATAAHAHAPAATVLLRMVTRPLSQPRMEARAAPSSARGRKTSPPVTHMHHQSMSKWSFSLPPPDPACACAPASN